MIERDSEKQPPKKPSTRRQLGDAPTLGELSPALPADRVTKRTNRRVRSRRQTRSADPRILRRWLALVLATAGLALLTLVVWVLIAQNRAPEPELQPVAQGAAAAPRPPAPSSAQAVELVERMLLAGTAAEIEPLIRTGGISPDEAIDFLAKTVELDGQALKPAWIGPTDSLMLAQEAVLVTYDTSHNRLALLVPDESGAWKVDFDAFMRRTLPDWETILAKGSGEGLIRVFASRNNYYNGPFSDDETWSCHALVSPDHKVAAYGYCRRGSPQERALERIEKRVRALFPGGDADQESTLARVTLKVDRPADAELRQFRILSVVADDWTIADQPLDEFLEGSPSGP